MELQINPMTKEDLLEIKDILLSDFDSFWSYSIWESELSNPNSVYLVAKIQEEIVGLGGYWKAVDDIHLTNIITKKSKRHQGIATKLLANLIELAKLENFLSLTLEVKETNIYAIQLYENYNFKKIGLRKNYYSQNENAILMTLSFI